MWRDRRRGIKRRRGGNPTVASADEPPDDDIVQVQCITPGVPHGPCNVSGGGGGGRSTPVTSGMGRHPRSGTPNSIYEQLDSGGNVRSRTFYDENGRPFTRQDFDHTHGKIQGPHEQHRRFDASGKPITPKTINPLPPGYDNLPTR
jgi:hypothetical protein